MSRCPIYMAAALLLGWTSVQAAPPRRLSASDGMQEVSSKEVDTAHLLPKDIKVLRDPAYKWKHLQTEHFIIHYDQKMFAAKVARFAESFYTAISADLPNWKDRVSPARSHIFIFNVHPREWRAFLDGQGAMEWGVSFCRGNALYLQELGQSTSQKMELLAHEITHLVFNRFLPFPIPLWLNEGLAEYYGEFAYRAAKGMGQSRKQAFPPLRNACPLPTLNFACAIRHDIEAVRVFYDTSKYLVGYLRLKHSPENWDAFFARVTYGEEAWAALLSTYGWADIEALEKDFRKFIR
ncbi:MAG: hypothetical protein LBN38_05180 [Verrucomicrobiota bacterium]|jgi:hypothetical protein|nr:hypothetical protein [Verrucomicrobiota bacterium]